MSRTFKIALATLAACLGASYLVFCFFYYIVGNTSVWGHQEFAKQGAQKIKVASQMEETFGQSRRFITYDAGGRSIWNSEFFLYNRYELKMQVPVKIISSTNGEIAGQPQFYLYEIGDVFTNSGVGVHYARNWQFYLEDWEKLYQARGNFSVINIALRTNDPVKNMGVYIEASR